jgi:hypothetical protein
LASGPYGSTLHAITVRKLVSPEHCFTCFTDLNDTLGDFVTKHLLSRAVSSPVHGVAGRAVALPARLTWKDHAGATRVASVMTREVTDDSVFVECESRTAIPLYRLVHLQIEEAAQGVERLPAPLRSGRVLSAVWHVAPTSPNTGTPGGYRLRFLVDPGATPTLRSRVDRAAHLMAAAS